MADRKQTPDILGEILGEVAAVPTPGAESPATRPIPVRRAQAAKKPAGQTDAPTLVEPSVPEARPRVGKWEYLLVSFQQHNGWRPRFINGQELEDWAAMPVIHDYANQLGEVGWELAGAASGTLYGLSDGKQLCFKREKTST
jgi:hypothetical protein